MILIGLRCKKFIVLSIEIIVYKYLWFYNLCVFITNSLCLQASWASHSERTCWVCGEAEGFGHWYYPAALHGVRQHWKIVDKKSVEIQWHVWNKMRGCLRLSCSFSNVLSLFHVFLVLHKWLSLPFFLFYDRDKVLVSFYNSPCLSAFVLLWSLFHFCSHHSYSANVVIFQDKVFPASSKL